MNDIQLLPWQNQSALNPSAQPLLYSAHEHLGRKILFSLQLSSALDPLWTFLLVGSCAEDCCVSGSVPTVKET